MLDKDKSLSVKGNVAWNTVGNIAYLGTQWLVTYVVVIVSGYESAGILSLAMTIATTCSSIAMFSMRSYQSSDVAGEYSNRDYLQSRYFTMFLALTICAVFSVLNNYPGSTLACIIFYMCFKLTEALSDIYQGVLQKKMRLDIAGVNLIVRGTLSLAAFSAALVLTRDLTLAIFCLFAVSFVLVLVLDKRAAEKLDTLGASHRDKVIRLLKACLPLAVYGFLFAFAGQAPRYFIELQLGSEPLGVYTSVALPVVLIQALAGFMFNPLATPMAIFIVEKRFCEFKKMIFNVLGMLVALFTVSIVGALLLGKPALVLLFGPSIEGYTYLVVPLVICAVFTATSWFLATVLTVLRKLTPLMWFSGIAMIVVLIGSIPCIEAFGLNGANFITIAALGCFMLLCAIEVLIASRAAMKESA